MTPQNTPVTFCHIIDASTENLLLNNSVKYSDRNKFSYSVLTFHAPGKLHEQMKLLGVRAFSLQHYSKLNLPRTIWRIYRYLRKEKIKIVQVHGFAASPAGLIAAKLAGTPVRIFSGHHSHEVPLYKKRALKFVDCFVARNLATNVVAPSEDMKRIFADVYKIPEKKLTVIHHGFDLENWRAVAGEKDVRKELELEGKIVFGAVGRLFWVKDIDTILRALAEMAKQRADVVLLVVGDGPDRRQLEALAGSLGISSQVIFTGKRMDIASVINSFDVFVHSAVAESFGMVFIEAFALGKPVISTPVGIATDIIRNGENGYLVETGNIIQMSEAMRQIISIKDKWSTIAQQNMVTAEKYAVQKTQTLCDAFYIKWLNEK